MASRRRVVGGVRPVGRVDTVVAAFSRPLDQPPPGRPLGVVRRCVPRRVLHTHQSCGLAVCGDLSLAGRAVLLVGSYQRAPDVHAVPHGVDKGWMVPGGVCAGVSGDQCRGAWQVLNIPTFGLPCPTTIFTAGLLLLATRHSRVLAIVPIVWSVIGGSPAFLLGVSADYALPVTGAALAVFELQEWRTSAAKAVLPLHRSVVR
jgi:Family of unknown function (DUF6064)